MVISPHVYPPTITTATVGYSGAALNQRLTLAHGYLNKVGYCKPGAACKTFPIVIGEFGTKLTDARDLQMMPQVRVWLAMCDCICARIGAVAIVYTGMQWSLYLCPRLVLSVYRS